jgi:hypothetical protein
MNHAANRRRIFALDNLVQAAQAQPANRLAHIASASDSADHPLNLERACFCFGHVFRQPLCGYCRSSSTVLERNSATLFTSFKRNSASKVALITLCGFEVPMDFVSTL